MRPCNGRIEIRADGGFRYTPNANYFGQDEFYYTVRDGVAGSDVGHVSLTVLPVNDAPYTEPDTYVHARTKSSSLPSHKASCATTVRSMASNLSTLN